MEDSSYRRYLKSAYIQAASTMALLAFVVLLCPPSAELATPSRARSAKAVTPARASMAQSPAAQARLIEAYGNLPLSFEANRGQAGPDVKFLSRGNGYTLLLTGNEAVLALQGRSQKAKGKSPRSNRHDDPLSLFTTQLLPATPSAQQTVDSPALLRLKLMGANSNAAVSGLNEFPGRSHYFLGNDPKKWRTNVPNYSKVKYESVYPGVDLVYYGNQRQLEYDFVVAPGADPRTIVLAIETGKSKFENRNSKIAANGDLVIGLTDSEVRFHKPVVYQETSAVGSRQSTAQNPGLANRQLSIINRQSVEGRFVLLAQNRIGFEVGAYDKTRPLVIDPELTYSTYLGGTDVELGLRIAVDALGSAYITGAAGPNFPTTSVTRPFGGNGTINNCYVDFSYHSFPCPDAFVTKLNPGGTAMLYSTYLGGSRADVASGIGVVSPGIAYVTGSTSSSDFPTTAGVLSTTSHGRGEIFVAKLNEDGSLNFSTFVGGSNDDLALNSAVDGSGNTYITGLTFSSDFATAGAYRTSLAAGTCTFNFHTFACPDAFVAKLNNTGTALGYYATYLGGSSYDAGLGVAVDGSGNAYVTGTTMSSNFPLVAAAQGTTSGGECGPTRSIHPCSDAFVTKLNAAGSGLGYSTYLGGTGDELGTAIAVDSAGTAYAAGITNSTDFPVTDGAAQAGFGGGACGSSGNSFNCPDAFVAKFNTDGSSGYATYLGGASYDGALGIAVNSAGNAYVTGATGSINFPTAFPIQGTFGGGACNTNGVALACPNAFLTKLSAGGLTAAFSTFLGGAGGDIGFGVAVDATGNAYLTGGTVSADFPKAVPLQANLGGQADVFIAKMSTSVTGPGAQLTPDSLAFDDQLKDSTSAAKTVTLTNNGDAALSITSVATGGTNGSDFAQTNDCGGSLTPSANCTISVTFKPTAVGDRTGTLTVTDNGPGGSQSIPLTGTGTDVSIAAPEGSSTSAEVAAGATATYNLVFTPAGFVGTMTLACTGAPTAAVCTPSPASVSLDGTTAANVTVTVTTTARSAAPPISGVRPAPPLMDWPPLRWLGLLSLVLLAALASAGMARDRRGRLNGLALGMAFLLVLVWAACNKESTPSQHGTPAGTYTLTLTGTAGGATRSTALTLKVN